MTPTKEQLAATEKVYLLREKAKNDLLLAARLGVAKNTLYTRLRLSNWSKAEVYFILNNFKNE